MSGSRGGGQESLWPPNIDIRPTPTPTPTPTKYVPDIYCNM